MNLHSFEVEWDDLRANLDAYVDRVFSLLQSDFLIMPKGNGFIEYEVFETGYETLKEITSGFRNFDTEKIKGALLEKPMVFIVLRTMLGFTPPEWAYVTSSNTGVPITQNQARSLDRAIRMNPLSPVKLSDEAHVRLHALIKTACTLLIQEVPVVNSGQLHRLDKADTKYGLSGIQRLSDMGVPYAMLLYERYLGRPFAGHRDSVSELIGDGLENLIEEVLTKSKCSFRKTKRAERIPGFDQAPDFILPSEFNPQIVIEAKITEDDGTARDKVTRIQHLAELSEQHIRTGKKGFMVIACIGGRGFGVRREDMRKLLLATKGKLFTPSTIDRLPEIIKK
jgi:hypothetical protein